MPTFTARTALRILMKLAIWFVIISGLITFYADASDPMPVSVLTRLGISAAILVFLSIPVIKMIGRIYLNTTPDEPGLDD